MKQLLPFSFVLSSLISFVSCDSSERKHVDTKSEPILLEVRENEKAIAVEEREPEPLPIEEPVIATESEEVPEALVDYEYFHKALLPMGTWYETAEYGSVWQPQASHEANWAPYTRGQWVYSEQGWTWVSTEGFGWATYHYGRWAKLQTQGWVWVPGTEWAPNWCSWRSNDSFIGWAPLPPETLAFPDRGWDATVESRYGITASCYNFVQADYFDQPIASYCLPTRQITTCFDVTRNITNIRFHNDRIFCGGPIYQDLSGRLGRRLPFCQLKRSRDFSRKAVSVKLRNRVEGDDLIVNAPKVRTTGPLQTRAQQIAVKVQRGKDADPRALEAFRQMRKRETDSVRKKIVVRESGKAVPRPTITRPQPKSRETEKQPLSKAKEEAAAQRKVRAEITRRQEQEAMARQRARVQEEAVQREAAERRQRELAEQKQEEEMQRQRVEAQRKQREVARRQQKEEDQRKALAAQRSAREAMQRKQREAAQREQEEEERLERIAEQKRQREQARREQEEEEQRQKIAAQRKAREEMQRRQREEAKRQKEADEQRRRIEEQKKQREEVARRQREEAEQKRQMEEQRRRIEEQKKQREEAERKRQEEEQRQRIEEQKRQREEAERQRREEAERKRQEEEQRQRVEEQRKAREEARRRQREETERQRERQKAGPSRGRGK